MPNKQPASHALAPCFAKLIYLSRETYISMAQNLYTFYAIGIYLLRRVQDTLGATNSKGLLRSAYFAGDLYL